MIRIPPLHCLLAFEALARLKSGALAAEELCISPSALTHRIRQLESLAGAVLFERQGYALTEAGHSYLAVVRDGLQALQRLPEVLAEPARRVLRVAVTPTVARQILMPRLPLFRLAYPDIELIVQLSIPLLNIKGEAADLEVRYGKGGYTDLDHTCILRDRVVPACSPDYLRDHGPFDQFTQAEDVARARLIRSPLEPWSTWFHAFQLPLREPLDGSQFNDVGLMLDAAAAGYGVTLLRETLGQAWLTSARLLRISTHSVASPFQHDLCWKPGALARWECSAFVEWISREL